MQCLTAKESENFIAKVGLDPHRVMSLGRIPSKKHHGQFHYKSRLPNAQSPAQALENWYPKFTTALFWISGAPWGDGWNENDEGMKHREEWSALKKLREHEGEARRLYDAPGHLIEAEEREKIVALGEIALLAGWDSALVARPDKAIVYYSHNDFIGIESDSNFTAVAQDLLELGFKQGTLQ